MKFLSLNHLSAPDFLTVNISLQRHQFKNINTEDSKQSIPLCFEEIRDQQIQIGKKNQKVKPQPLHSPPPHPPQAISKTLLGISGGARKWHRLSPVFGKIGKQHFPPVLDIKKGIFFADDSLEKCVGVGAESVFSTFKSDPVTLK